MSDSVLMNSFNGTHCFNIILIINGNLNEDTKEKLGLDR